jgi:hypothetical protein
MGLPNTLPGKGNDAKKRDRYAKRVGKRHGENLLKDLAHVARYGYNLNVWQWEGRTSPVGGHAAHSMHYQRYPDGIGKAFDAYGTASNMEAFGRWVGRHAPQVDEGIHNPGLSRKNGKNVAPSFWGSSTWSAHINHVHLGNDGPPS